MKTLPTNWLNWVAQKRWARELAALDKVLGSMRAELKLIQEGDRGDHYVRAIEEAALRNPSTLEATVYNIVAQQASGVLGKAGERLNGGGDIEFVHLNDNPAEEIIVEPKHVLTQVHDFLEGMGVVNTANPEVATSLLLKGGNMREATPAAEWEGRVLGLDNFYASLGRMRWKHGTGPDGWKGVTLRVAPVWMQLLFHRQLRNVANSHDFSEWWYQWMVRMIPKRDKNAAIFKFNRDIWMCPHVWKLMTGMLFSEYGGISEAVMPDYASGFRRFRGAAEVVMTVRLMTEDAVAGCVTLTRLFIDLKGFFMGVNRAFQFSAEKALGVLPQATELMMCMANGMKGHVVTKHGLTKGVPVPGGNGQGCICSPPRSCYVLLPLQFTVARLVPGHRFITRGRSVHNVIPQLSFADDITMTPVSPRALMMAADIAWVCCFVSGNRIGTDAEGTKTAFSVSKCDADSGHYDGGGHGYEITMPDGTSIPSVTGSYRCLGSQVDGSIGNSETLERVAWRCTNVIRLLGRVGGLDRKQYDRMCTSITSGLCHFYARSTPFDWETSEQIETARRKAYARMGFRARCGPRVQVYSPAAAGGLGVTHFYVHAAVALFDQVDRALCGKLGEPARAAIESRIATTAVGLGYVPSIEAPTPLDWLPWHLREHLRVEYIVECWLLVQMQAGVRSRNTGASRGSGTPLDPELWEVPNDGGGASVWASIASRLFSRDLCSLGLWRWVDFYAGSVDGAGTWMDWGQAYSYYEVERRQRSGHWKRRVQTEFEAVISALRLSSHASEWLQHYTAATSFEESPDEHVEVQKRLQLYDNGLRVQAVLDVRESGRWNKGVAELEYVIKWEGWDEVIPEEAFSLETQSAMGFFRQCVQAGGTAWQ